MDLGPVERSRAQELHVGVPRERVTAGTVLLTGLGPTWKPLAGAAEAGWEHSSHQPCPQGWAQHSSRLPADALAEPAQGWHCHVAKQ